MNSESKKITSPESSKKGLDLTKLNETMAARGDWSASSFDKELNQSAVEQFNQKKAYTYEPARGIDERQ